MQRVLEILSGQYILMSSLKLDLWTSKSIVVIYSLGCTSVLSLKSVKQRCFQDTEWSLYSYVHFDP
jgi:hypothetical protein